jgi:IrrE N-terminal-like domain
VTKLSRPASSPRRWANRLVVGLDPLARADLAADPASAISRHFGLRVEPRESLGQRGHGGWCDGLSIAQDDVIYYAPTMNSKRENFTLCHEVGHHLVQRDEDDDTLDWAADLQDRDIVIEEVCNLIASLLLVPDDLVRRALDEYSMGGDALEAIISRSEGSREVCAIAMAQHLRCDGFVAVVNLRSPAVTLASRAHEARPYPARNEVVPAGHPLLSLENGQSQATESWWRWPDGNPFSYYQHATRRGHWVYAVFAVNDLWNVAKFHAGEPERPKIDIPRRDLRCACGFAGEIRGFPCSVCRKPVCPSCGCDCDRSNRIERGMCMSCFLAVPVSQLVDGLCTGCR